MKQIRYTVYFERSNGDLIKVGSGVDALSLVDRFCSDHNFKIPYYRTWNATMKGREMTCVDVGSHTEFFWVWPVSDLFREETGEKNDP